MNIERDEIEEEAIMAEAKKRKHCARIDNDNPEWYAENELLPCPFCGNDPDQAQRLFEPMRERYAVYCPCCEFYGPIGSSKQIAIKAWNARSEC